MTIRASHFILYVSDQRRSTEFYSRTITIEPRLNVPGMTEYEIAESVVLGLMPLASVSRLFDKKPEEVKAKSILRAELYLIVDQPQLYHQRALEAGARELSPFSTRDWGHQAAYSADIDGNVIAFGEVVTEQASANTW